MRLLSKRFRASFTVEASVVLPLITFIMIGMLYYICFLHDCALIQSLSLRTAEAAACAQQYRELAVQADRDPDSLQEKVIMSTVSEPSVQAQSFSLLAVYRSLKSYRSASAQSSMSLQIPVSQTAVFTGEQWNSSCRVTAMTVDYPADWLKKQIREKQR